MDHFINLQVSYFPPSFLFLESSPTSVRVIILRWKPSPQFKITQCHCISLTVMYKVLPQPLLPSTLFILCYQTGLTTDQWTGQIQYTPRTCTVVAISIKKVLIPDILFFVQFSAQTLLCKKELLQSPSLV